MHLIITCNETHHILHSHYCKKTDDKLNGMTEKKKCLVLLPGLLASISFIFNFPLRSLKTVHICCRANLVPSPIPLFFLWGLNCVSFQCLTNVQSLNGTYQYAQFIFLPRCKVSELDDLGFCSCILLLATTVCTLTNN